MASARFLEVVPLGIVDVHARLIYSLIRTVYYLALVRQAYRKDGRGLQQRLGRIST